MKELRTSVSGNKLSLAAFTDCLIHLQPTIKHMAERAKQEKIRGAHHGGSSSKCMLVDSSCVAGIVGRPHMLSTVTGLGSTLSRRLGGKHSIRPRLGTPRVGTVSAEEAKI
jgi:hypothetical protein